MEGLNNDNRCVGIWRVDLARKASRSTCDSLCGGYFKVPQISVPSHPTAAMAHPVLDSQALGRSALNRSSGACCALQLIAVSRVKYVAILHPGATEARDCNEVASIIYTGICVVHPEGPDRIYAMVLALLQGTRLILASVPFYNTSQAIRLVPFIPLDCDQTPLASKKSFSTEHYLHKCLVIQPQELMIAAIPPVHIATMPSLQSLAWQQQRISRPRCGYCKQFTTHMIWRISKKYGWHFAAHLRCRNHCERER